MTAAGLVFDLQGFSVHDGPGCRTLVFLSGCPLRCDWCANPEGLLPQPRLLYRRQRCRPSAFRCVAACPHGAARPGGVGESAVQFDRDRCDHCSSLACVAACRREALRVAGRTMTVEELMRVLERDSAYWGEGGGVTFGGGEPFAQPGFLLEALRRCREGCIHTAVETSALVATGQLLEALPLVDWLFVDLKHSDPDAHRRGTGAGNQLVLANLEALARGRAGTRVVVRIPVVPGFNDDRNNLVASAALLGRLGLAEVHLLPFHRLGASKYEQLGQEWAFAAVPSPSAAELAAAAVPFRAAGLQVWVDEQTPF
jgi:pyruvate formate lyase activating enzyme